MTLAEKLLEVIEGISEEKLHEIIGFAEYLKQKELKESKALIDSLISDYDEALTHLAK